MTIKRVIRQQTTGKYAPKLRLSKELNRPKSLYANIKRQQKQIKLHSKLHMDPAKTHTTT